MNPFMTMHLHMLRAACMTVITGIDLTLAASEAPEPDAPPAATEAEESKKKFSSDPLKCEHPRTHWQAVPAMGHPDRVLCKCGEEMEA